VFLYCDFCCKPFASTDFNWTETGGMLCDKCRITKWVDETDASLDDIIHLRSLEWWAGFFGWSSQEATLRKVRKTLRSFFEDRGILEQQNGILARTECNVT
jgi:hypothetical protein